MFVYDKKKMKEVVNRHHDVIIIDSNHKTNRFNLSLLDSKVTENMGKSRTCFVALIENLQTQSYLWAFEKFKESLSFQPNVIFFSD